MQVLRHASTRRGRIRRGPSPLAKQAIGLATLLAAVVALALAFSPSLLPWNQRLEFKLEAGTFGVMNQGSWVELGGTKIGDVKALAYDHGRAVLTVEVDPAYAGMLHADAGADIRPHGLLGPKYVQLNPGTTGRLTAGATIPISRVHESTDFDQVLNSLQPDVRRSIQTIFIELGTASAGRGDDMNAALLALGNAAQDLNTTTATVRARDANVSGIIDASERFNRDIQNAPISQNIADTNQVLTGLAQIDDHIGSGIDNTAAFAQHLDVVMGGGNDRNLAQVLAKAPHTIDRLRTVLVAGNTILVAVNTPKDGFGYSSLQALMTAVMFTKSAFGEKDASGHFVYIYTVAGPCSAPAPTGSALGCSGYVGADPNHPAAAAKAVTPGPSRLSDQQLVDLFLGN